MPIVSIYCDEVLPSRNNEDDNFIILGMLIVEEQKKNRVLDSLKNVRCLNDKNNKWYDSFENCPKNSLCKKELHEGNNTKVHFTEIKNHKVRKDIAQKWIKLLKFDLLDEINFHILVIDLKKLESKEFGKTNVNMNIYNRFFRTLIKGGIKRHYVDRIYIKNIYHHQGSQEKHNFFPETNMKKLTKEIEDKSIIVEKKRIAFLDGDHRKYEDKTSSDNSQLIQLIDCILGSFAQLLINRSKRDSYREIAEYSREIFNNALGKDWDYPYSVSAFPRYSYEEMKGIAQQALNHYNFTHDYEMLDMAIGFTNGNVNNFHNDIEFKMPPYTKEGNRLTSWLK